MKIAYYVTSHGFGHGVRACAICNHLSHTTSVVFRTTLPESFLKEEVKRSFDYCPKSFDCGCVQSDGVTVDIEKTIAAYSAIAKNNAATLAEEAAWCRTNRIDGIISDIVPFAFEVAEACAVPSIAVTNFTWYDIYQEYCKAYPDFRPIVEKIQAQYRSADLLLALSPSLPMAYFTKRKSMGIVGRLGSNIREDISEAFAVPRGKNMGLIYTGTFGMDAMAWTTLERFKAWEFFGLYPLPGNPANYHVVTKTDFSYQDIIASVDCVISKMGYGVYAECVLNGVPLIYLPREAFAEYPALDGAMAAGGSGYRVSHREFYNFFWDEALARALSRPRPAPAQSDGAKRCAREIEKMLEKHQ